MIPLLRAGALALNLLVLAGVPLLFGAHPAAAAAMALVLLWISWRLSRRAPTGEPATPEVLATALRVSRRMAADPPVFVRFLPGWTAGAVETRGGYGLLLGEAVEPRHREEVLAHEIAHHLLGDLFWEPFTDGPTRILFEVARRVPPFLLIVFPFLIFGIPLARATELAADDFATRVYPTYPVVLKEVASMMGRAESLFYPSLERRISRAARHSSGNSRND